MIYLNSTLPARRGLLADHSASSLHYWGYEPSPFDISLAIASTRFQIVLRSKLFGLDLLILWRVIRSLWRGERHIYLVTQVDLLAALPLIKWLFPSVKVVTWIWTAEDVRFWERSLRACHHVFALTTGALEVLQRTFSPTRSSLQIWGGDSRSYRLSVRPARNRQLGLFGLTSRDVKTVACALQKLNVSILVTKRAALQFQNHLPSGMLLASSDYLQVIDPQTERDFIIEFHRVEVMLIPLFKSEKQPVGYTNLIEALFCGCSVIIPQNSILPSEVIQSVGVFTYEAEDAVSLCDAIQRARLSRTASGHVENIQESAHALFDGRELSHKIRELFALPVQAE